MNNANGKAAQHGEAAAERVDSEWRPPEPRHGERDPGGHAVIHYTVNGERQRTEKSVLTVEEILRHAGAGAGIDVNRLGDYYLETVNDDREYRNLTDQIRLHDGNQFLAIYSGRTPVA